MYIMKFIDDLYLGQAVKAKEKRIIKKIKKGSFFTGAYVICLPEKTDEPLEFYSARLLKQDYYKRHEPTIIGAHVQPAGFFDTVLQDIIYDLYGFILV